MCKKLNETANYFHGNSKLYFVPYEPKTRDIPIIRYRTVNKQVFPKKIFGERLKIQSSDEVIDPPITVCEGCNERSKVLCTNY